MSQVKEQARLGAVNCDTEKELCGQHKVEGFPTIKVFGKDQNNSYFNMFSLVPEAPEIPHITVLMAPEAPGIPVKCVKND